MNRAEGILWGLAAGDRIGGPLQMALCLATSLARLRRFDREDVGARYLRWWSEEGFDTGPTADRVFALVARGSSFDDAALRVDREAGGMTAGCNPVHRSAPLAMLLTLPDEELAQIALAEAALTHRHPLAGDVAAATVVLCRALLRGVSWREAVKIAAKGRMAETRAALEEPDTMVHADGYAPHALGAAIHFLNEGPSFAAALAAAIDYAGPANYCPVLVGSIGGARWGRSMIPDNLLGHCLGVLPRIRSLGSALAGA